MFQPQAGEQEVRAHPGSRENRAAPGGVTLDRERGAPGKKMRELGYTASKEGSILEAC